MPHSAPSLSENSSCVQTSFKAKKLPSSACARQTGVRPASTCFMVSIGSSSVDATRWLANARLQLGLDELPRVLERDALEDVAEESLYEHPLAGRLGEAALAEAQHVPLLARPDSVAAAAAT